jgi:hypothetical protein
VEVSATRGTTAPVYLPEQFKYEAETWNFLETSRNIP